MKQRTRFRPLEILLFSSEALHPLQIRPCLFSVHNSYLPFYNPSIPKPPSLLFNTLSVQSRRNFSSSICVRLAKHPPHQYHISYSRKLRGLISQNTSHPYPTLKDHSRHFFSDVQQNNLAFLQDPLFPNPNSSAFIQPAMPIL
jgi:hypothetical protein